jgi:hypothetical protein
MARKSASNNVDARGSSSSSNRCRRSSRTSDRARDRHRPTNQLIAPVATNNVVDFRSRATAIGVRAPPGTREFIRQLTRARHRAAMAPPLLGTWHPPFANHKGSRHRLPCVVRATGCRVLCVKEDI